MISPLPRPRPRPRPPSSCNPLLPPLRTRPRISIKSSALILGLGHIRPPDFCRRLCGHALASPLRRTLSDIPQSLFIAGSGVSYKSTHNDGIFWLAASCTPGHLLLGSPHVGSRLLQLTVSIHRPSARSRSLPPVASFAAPTQIPRVAQLSCYFIFPNHLKDPVRSNATSCPVRTTHNA